MSSPYTTDSESFSSDIDTPITVGTDSPVIVATVHPETITTSETLGSADSWSTDSSNHSSDGDFIDDNTPYVMTEPHAPGTPEVADNMINQNSPGFPNMPFQIHYAADMYFNYRNMRNRERRFDDNGGFGY